MKTNDPTLKRLSWVISMVAAFFVFIALADPILPTPSTQGLSQNTNGQVTATNKITFVKGLAVTNAPTEPSDVVRFVDLTSANRVFFPAAQTVFLDLNYASLTNGNAAFGTAQTAYDAAEALAVSSGSKVALMVGRGNAADFGGITLTNNWEPNVILVGLGPATSQIGVINGENAAGNSFSVNIRARAVKISGIWTDTSMGPGATENGGAITIKGDGDVQIGDQGIYSDIQSVSSGIGGDIDLTGCFSETADNLAIRSGGYGPPFSGNCGNITITRCRLLTGSSYGIDAFVDGVTGKTSGNVIIIDSETGYIAAYQINGADQNGGNITITNSKTKELYVAALGGGVDGVVKVTGSEIRGSETSCIDRLGSTAVLLDSRLKIEAGGFDCIANLSANGATFINCVMDVDGTGKEINASAARTIKAFDLKVKNGVGANVTVSEGNILQSSAIQVP